MISFTEEQRFRQWWAVLIVVLPAAVLTWGLLQQTVFERPWGDPPLSNAALVLTWVFVGMGLPVFILSLKLVTEVDDDGVHVRFKPLPVGAHYLYPSITGHAAIDYRPMREFGGWGIRWGGKGRRAWSVSGTRAVQLDFANGKQVVIGSQRADELNLVIASGMARRR